MITIDVIFYGKTITEESRIFDSRITALRFMYAMKKRGNKIVAWYCDDPSDNEYLRRRFYK